MKKILLFGGTSEGRILAEFLGMHQIETCVCVATAYGEQQLIPNQTMQVLAKRQEEEQMKALMEKETFELVIDATHPYAVVVSQNIKRACEECGIQYIRVLREQSQEQNGILVESVSEAVEVLQKTQGNIFITTGSKELLEFTKLENYEERCYARVLSSSDVVLECNRLGFTGKHLICMQGPFGKDMNQAMLVHTKAAYLVTKESGAAGGFEEKIAAALEENVIPIVIGRPVQEEGETLERTKEIIKETYGIVDEGKRHVTLLGIGMGARKLFTLEAEQALRNCQVVIGAKRVLESIHEEGKPTFPSVNNDEIIQFMKRHTEYREIVVAFSGDIGFYSGAKRLLPYLAEYEVQMISGISSPIYFMDQLGVPWEDARLLSLHGRNCDLVKEVWEHDKVFALLGGEETVKSICHNLIENHLEDVRITVGENLSYESEKFISGTPVEILQNHEFSKMTVILIENHRCSNRVVTYGMADELFLRDKVPMTKSEVRSISISKLLLHDNSIVVDIGAGTGSISVEVSRIVTNGEVYAIEQKKDAIRLIEENKKKFYCNNLTVIEGEALACIESLPAVTHAFLGGTSGHMKQIINQLIRKHPGIRMVMNVITLETISEVIQILKELPIVDLEIVQVNISKDKLVGAYHLMMGQNPVTIISFTGKVEGPEGGSL